MQVPNITDELWVAFDAYKAAMKNEKETDEKITPLLDELVKNFAFKKALTNSKGKLLEEGIIEKESDIYLASEEDAKKYFLAAGKLYKELGYELEENHCPVLISRKERVDAMHVFINESFYLVEDTGATKHDLYGNIYALREYCEKTVQLLETLKK